MSLWRCVKTVVMNRGKETEYTAFTENEVYEARWAATPSGQRALCFTNDIGQNHLAFGKWLFEHFKSFNGIDGG